MINAIEYLEMAAERYPNKMILQMSKKALRFDNVPPKSNRKNPGDYDKQLYKQHNEIKRLFRRIKGFRRIFTRYNKLDIII